MRLTKFFMVLFILSIQVFFTYADDIKIKGKIVDKKTNESVPLANVGILGTYHGTASDYDGNFTLTVSGDKTENILQISAVGYTTFNIKISAIKNPQDLTVELLPKDYKIEEVEVEAKSLFYHKVIKTAADKIPENYLTKPFHYDAYYKNIKKENTRTQKREAVVRIYDVKGYNRTNFYDAFIQRNYKFLKSKRSFEIKTLESGMTLMDNLLEMDIVRTTGNILDGKYIHDYEIKFDHAESYENDSLWVIAYNCNEPSVLNTGDSYAFLYKGKIAVRKSDYAVIRNQTMVQATDYSKFGRSFYNYNKDNKWRVTFVEYSFTTNYKKSGNYYELASINFKQTIDCKNAQGKSKKITNDAKLKVTFTETAKPEKITKRSYFERLAYDENFWSGFKE